MCDLLFLCHRIPYPPDKGEKIRAWNLLKGLAERYRVHLGAFVDDPDDWPHAGVLREVCADVYLRPLTPVRGRLRVLRALASGDSLSVAYYADPRMRRWVNERLPGMDSVLVYSSVMAQYIPDAVGAAPPPRIAEGTAPDNPDDSPADGRSCSAEGRVRRPSRDASCAASPRTTYDLMAASASPPRPMPPFIADFVDVDSEKWRAYGEQGGGMGWLYRIEARRLAAFERARAASADRTLFVTEAERECFLRGAPELAERVQAVPNGVDTAFFSPEQAGQKPYANGPVIVFTGAMDYRPNVEAVLWFTREVFPRIREREPTAEFWIVGLRPTPAVEALAEKAGVMVTGRVPDVRPYIGHAAAAVAPLNIARGVQNKVLEAMAMAKAVVCTPQALEGIEARPGEQVLVARDPAPFVEAVLTVIQRPDRARELGSAALRYVRERHGWAASVAMVEQLLAPAEDMPPGPDEASTRTSSPAEGRVRHPAPEMSHAAAPGTPYSVCAPTSPDSPVGGAPRRRIPTIDPPPPLTATSTRRQR